MPGCVAYGCSNSSKKGFLMKVFPRDPVIRAIWAEKVNREGWTPTNHSCLCEIHFESEKWEKPRVDGRRKLKWNAVPTLFANAEINKQKRKSPTKRGSPIKKRKLVRTQHTSVPNQQHECEDTESLTSTEHQSSPISSSLQVYCQKYGNPEPDTELQNIKQEPDYKVQTVNKEANGDEESDISPIMNRSSTSSRTLSSPENSFLYCEMCQLKYDGGCPEHGPVIYMDNAEEGQGESYSLDSSPQVQVVDNKDRQVLWREKVEQSKVCKAYSDEVGTLPNGGCSTESSEMFSVCEMNTELCVAGTSCGIQSNVKMNVDLCVAGTSCGLQSNVEMNTELCVAGTSCRSQSNIEIKAGHYIRNSEKHFRCNLCGVGFFQSRGLKTHMITHTGEKPYRCDVCGTGFTQQYVLKRHKTTHTGEKPYKCDVCGLGFTQQGYLKIHKRIHTGEKRYQCDVCGLGFTRQNCLNRHMRKHTGERPYKCNVCGLGFTQKSSLKRHMCTHTGEKPYKCDVCGLGFTQPIHLTIHKRKHTGEKPYKCHMCGLGFTCQGGLNIHKRTHTGEKPYKCDLCGARFTQNVSLMSHKRTHTTALQM